MKRLLALAAVAAVAAAVAAYRRWATRPERCPAHHPEFHDDGAPMQCSKRHGHDGPHECDAGTWEADWWSILDETIGWEKVSDPTPYLDQMQSSAAAFASVTGLFKPPRSAP